jgi:hypothetical protein
MACSCCDAVSSCLEQSCLGEEVLGQRISKGELTNRVIDRAKPSRRSDMKACHVMDPRSTNDKGNQMDKV